jgi:2'-5' RNA ligase
MARLFTAVDLAPEVRAAIALARDGLLQRLPEPHRSGLRPAGSAQLHLTLVFIGEVDEARVTDVTAALARGFSLPPFEIAFGRCGVFPPRGRARVLWLGIAAGEKELRQLFELTALRLQQAGVAVDTGSFTPHLTLGRWRDGSGPSRFTPPEVSTLPSQRVSELTLFRSQLGASGAVHTRLTTGSLGVTKDGNECRDT